MCNINDLVTLQTHHAEAILATYLVGSRAYGTASPESDEDYRGIFVLPSREYLSICESVNYRPLAFALPQSTMNL